MNLNTKLKSKNLEDNFLIDILLPKMCFKDIEEISKTDINKVKFILTTKISESSLYLINDCISVVDLGFD